MTKDEILNGMSEQEFYSMYPTREAWEQSQQEMAYGGSPFIQGFPFGAGITMADGGTPYYGGPIYPAQNGVQTPGFDSTNMVLTGQDNLSDQQIANANLTSLGNNEYINSAGDSRFVKNVNPVVVPFNPYGVQSKGKFANNPNSFLNTGIPGVSTSTNNSSVTDQQVNTKVRGSVLPILGKKQKYGGLPGGPHQYDMPCMNCGGYMEDGGNASPFNYGAFPAMQGGGDPNDLWLAQQQLALEKRTKQGVPSDVKPTGTNPLNFNPYIKGSDIAQTDSMHTSPYNPNIAAYFKGNKMIAGPAQNTGQAIQAARKVNTGKFYKKDNEIYPNYQQDGGGFINDGSYPMMNNGGIDYSSTINDVFSKYQKKSGGVTSQGGNQNLIKKQQADFYNAIQSNVINKFNQDERDIANQVTQQATQEVDQAYQGYQMGGGPGMSYGYNAYGAPNLDNQYNQEMLQAKINSYKDQHAQDRENMFGANQMLAGYIDQTLSNRRAGAQEAMGMYKAQSGGDWDAAWAQQEAEEARRTAAYSIEKKKAKEAYINSLRQKGKTAENTQNPSWSQQAMQSFGPDNRLNGFNYFPGNVGRGYEFGKADMAKLSKLTANDPLTGVQLNYGRLGRMAPRFFGPKSITFGTVNPNKGYFEDLKEPVSYDQSKQQNTDVNYFKEDREATKRRAEIAKIGPDAYKRNQAFDDMSWSEKRASKKAMNQNLNQTIDQAKRFEKSKKEVGAVDTENAYGGLYKAQAGYQNPLAFKPTLTEDDGMDIMPPPMSVAPADPNANSFDQASIQKKRQELRDLTGAPMGDAPDIMAPDSVTAKSKLKGVKNLIGQYAVPGINKLASMFEQDDLENSERALEQGMLADNAKVTRPANAFNMGTYNVNSGDFRENQKNSSQYPGFNAQFGGFNTMQMGGGMDDSWEDDLTEDEIENLRAQGYNIEYLD
jgi:hypothetical protein